MGTNMHKPLLKAPFTLYPTHAAPPTLYPCTCCPTHIILLHVLPHSHYTPAGVVMLTGPIHHALYQVHGTSIT